MTLEEEEDTLSRRVRETIAATVGCETDEIEDLGVDDQVYYFLVGIPPEEYHSRPTWDPLPEPDEFKRTTDTIFNFEIAHVVVTGGIVDWEPGHPWLLIFVRTFSPHLDDESVQNDARKVFNALREKFSSLRTFMFYTREATYLKEII